MVTEPVELLVSPAVELRTITAVLIWTRIVVYDDPGEIGGHEPHLCQPQEEVFMATHLEGRVPPHPAYDLGAADPKIRDARGHGQLGQLAHIDLVEIERLLRAAARGIADEEVADVVCQPVPPGVPHRAPAEVYQIIPHHLAQEFDFGLLGEHEVVVTQEHEVRLDVIQRPIVAGSRTQVVGKCLILPYLRNVAGNIGVGLRAVVQYYDWHGWIVCLDTLQTCP